jgi:hypothetical protein
MFWELVELKDPDTSAETLLPKIEEKKSARAVKGAKDVPSNREKARTALNILN